MHRYEVTVEAGGRRWQYEVDAETICYALADGWLSGVARVSIDLDEALRRAWRVAPANTDLAPGDSFTWLGEADGADSHRPPGAFRWRERCGWYA